MYFLGLILIGFLILTVLFLGIVCYKFYRQSDLWRHKAEVATLEKVEALTLAKESETLHQKFQDTYAELAATKEKLAVAMRDHHSLVHEFQKIAQDVLKHSKEDFIKLADQVFEKHKNAAQSDLQKGQEILTNLTKPIEQSLKEYQEKLHDIEKARSNDFGRLNAEIRQMNELQNLVRQETGKLTHALKASPKTRGRWGEYQLRNLLELSGMSLYCDFKTEVHMQRGDERLRPDVIIRLPENGAIVVDAKTSLDAYLEAVDTSDDQKKQEHLKKHAQHLRDHYKKLSEKAYWENLDVSPDFVAMFIPGDHFYNAALEYDPNLFEDAFKNNVLIVTPGTLIALAKVVARVWRQQNMIENVQEIAHIGKNLFQAFVTMNDHLIDVSKNLRRTVESHDRLIGSYDANVLPKARKLQELDIGHAINKIKEVDILSLEPRLPKGKNIDDPKVTNLTYHPKT
ncbi:MAG: DNA recombination protein RmuC [Alphaproteobacteria bacterium]|nr:DNA recombination protein RmuC [Alphaproteobacteria bacterium]